MYDGGDEERGREEEEKERRVGDKKQESHTEMSGTRTPHRDVGKHQKQTKNSHKKWDLILAPANHDGNLYIYTEGTHTRVPRKYCKPAFTALTTTLHGGQNFVENLGLHAWIKHLLSPSIIHGRPFLV